MSERLDGYRRLTLQEADAIQRTKDSHPDTLIASCFHPTIQDPRAEEERPLKAKGTHALLSFALETHIEEAGLSICPSCRKQDEGSHPTTASHLGELQLVVHIHTMLSRFATSRPKCRTQTGEGDICFGTRLPVLCPLHIHHMDVELRVLQLERPTHEDVHLCILVIPEELLHQSRPRSACSA